MLNSENIKLDVKTGVRPAEGVTK